MESCFTIIGIRIEHRADIAPAVQEMLTEFGGHIRARLGLHEVGGGTNANEGLVILQVCGEMESLVKMVAALNGFDGVKAKLIDLS